MLLLHIIAEIKTARQKNITSIILSRITVPNMEERDKFSHLPINTARVISPRRGITQLTPYPIIIEPKRFFKDVSFFTELSITFHLNARKKCDVRDDMINIIIQKIEACDMY
jgi:hypothetical protein